jgi:hypothetical protein
VLTSRACRAPSSFGTRGCEGCVKNLTKSLIATEGLQVRILAGKSSILGIEFDRAQQAGDSFWKLATEGENDGAHIMRVIVKRFVANDLANVPEGLGVFAGIKGQGCGVKLFLNATWRGFGLRPTLSVANIEIELNPLVQLLLIGVIREHCAE